MNDFPRWKYALVVFALTVGFLYSLPNVFRPQPAVQISANRGSVVDDALKATVAGYLDAAKIVADRIEVVNDRLLVRLPKSDDQGNVMNNASNVIKSGLAKDNRGDGYVIALNLASTVPGWLRAIGADSMPLGLDLQGGVHFLMQVDDKEVFEKQDQRHIEDIRAVLRAKDIRYQSVGRGPQGIIVQLRSSEDREAAAGVITVAAPELDVKNGTVVGEAYTLIANIKPEEITRISQDTIKQNVSTLRNRINALGVSEPIIVQQGLNRIVVELAGVQDTADAKTKLGATATLEYRAVDESANPIEAERTGQVAPDSRLYKMRDGRPIVLKKKVIATGDELVDASSAPDPQTGSPAVSVVLNESGGRKMLDFTTQNVGKRMGVVYIERTPEVKIVDGQEVRSTKITEEVINAATVNGVFGKRFQTSGIGSAKEASDLALFLRSGSLAAPVDIVSERVIGPSQGQDNIQKGVFATILALVLVIVFVAFYYKVFGLIADLALILNLVLLVAILSMFQATLTLPGIAGIVLTLGMAIDANVLICERIREELRNGSTPLAAIRGGYDKAWATIFDANLTHLIAALGLMTFGSGPLRGFAVTLTIGILTSMFTSVTITRALISLVYSGRRLKHVSV